MLIRYQEPINVLDAIISITLSIGVIQVKINLEGVKGIFSEEQIKILKDTFKQLEKEYENIHFSEINISAVKIAYILN